MELHMQIIIKQNHGNKLKYAIAILLLPITINSTAKATVHQTINGPSLPEAASKLDKRWVLIGESNSALLKPGEPGTTYYFLDTTTIHQSSGIIRFWICEIFSKDSFAFISGIHKRISKWEYNLNNDMTRMGSISTFGEAEYAISSNNEVSEWMSLRPGSTTEGLIKSVLQYKEDPHR